MDLTAEHVPVAFAIRAGTVWRYGHEVRDHATGTVVTNRVEELEATGLARLTRQFLNATQYELTSAGQYWLAMALLEG